MNKREQIHDDRADLSKLEAMVINGFQISTTYLNLVKRATDNKN